MHMDYKTVVCVIVYYENLYVTVHFVELNICYKYIYVYGYLSSLVIIEDIPNSLFSPLY